MDHANSQNRSALMRSVKPKGSAREITVRRMIHGMGYRFNLRQSDLQGSPDLVFPSREKPIFENRCFWHAILDVATHAYRRAELRIGRTK